MAPITSGCFQLVFKDGTTLLLHYATQFGASAGGAAIDTAVVAHGPVVAIVEILEFTGA